MSLLSTTLNRFKPFKRHVPMLVYLIGIFPLGMWQGSLRLAWGDLPVFVAVIAYLLLLRYLGFFLVRFIDFRSQQAVVAHNQAVDNSKQRRKKI
jgi:hypothetical protein